jgi:hypothetical protein
VRPLQHFAVVALPVTVYSLVRYRRLPTGYTVLILLVATQLPDIIDKPLAWTFGVLPSGRMLAHSIVISGPVLSTLCLLGIYLRKFEYTGLFAVAYLSHIVEDFYPILWQGRSYYFFPNLFWPALPANPDRNPSFGAHAPPSLVVVLITLAGFGLVTGYVAFDLYHRRDPLSKTRR